MAIFFALLAFFGWGVGDTCAAIAARKMGTQSTFVFTSLLAFLIQSVGILYFGFPRDIGMLGVAVFMAGVNMVGTYAYIKGLEISNASLTGAIAGSYGIVAVLLSIVFFGEKLTSLQWLGFLLSIAGILLVTINFRAIFRYGLGNIVTDRSLLWALLPFFFWGVYFGFIRIPIERIGWFWAAYPLTWTFPAVMVIKKISLPSLLTRVSQTHTWGLCIGNVILITLAILGVNVGILIGQTSVVATISSSFVILFIILTQIFFKERFSKVQAVGMISVILGIIFISLEA